MSSFTVLLTNLSAAQAHLDSSLNRLTEELKFASQLLEAHPDRAAEWEPLLEQAASLVADGLASGGSPEALVTRAESLLAPLCSVAKEYSIYCAGHAHIDMNWMWTWPETVAVTYDTFTTMDRLMDEFPDFHFSQSQASVYAAMQKYAPEVFAMIQRRVEEGRWEVTASQWVEGDKNMASGEILCRHLLYTRRWLRENLGLAYDAVKIDWQCDTFGHAWTVPGILRRGGVGRYYHHRANGLRLRAATAGEAARLFWWEGPDGARVLAYDDSPYGYNCEITPRMVDGLLTFCRLTGMQEMLWVYGVGDHGGGPTRVHLRAAREMQAWPLWPHIKLTTTDDYFSTVESQPAVAQLPVHQGELNFVFEGCYTSESGVKFANRQSENALVEAEAVALLGRAWAGMSYPRQALTESWERAMFLQFHDILPGSGFRETYEHAQGLFQETLANTGMIRTRSLRGIAERVDTSSLGVAQASKPASGSGGDLGLGAGVGNGAFWGGVSSLGAGAAGSDPFLVFNPAAFPRSELIKVKVWNRDLPDRVQVRDAAGTIIPAQVVERGPYWGHRFVEVAFWAEGLPALGYRGYVVEPSTGETETQAWKPALPGGAYFKELGRPLYGLNYVRAQFLSPVALGNDLMEVALSGEAGGIISVVDKETGLELVPEGMVLGAIEREQEAPHGMTAWQLGAIVDRVEPLAGCTMERIAAGPVVAAVRLTGKHGESTYKLDISLASGTRQIEFRLEVDWLERGTEQTGVPVLRASFPLNITEGRAFFEIPCGSIERPADGEEAPALNWVALNGASAEDPAQRAGATLVNNCKYGHRLGENEIRLTLLRSSYDPDPLPELGTHEIRYALAPYVDDYCPGAAHRSGYAFNHPCLPVGTTAHAGELPAENSLAEVLTHNALLSGLKQAEDSEAIIVRLFETAGQEVEAQVRLAPALVAPDAPAVETDLLEQPLAQSTARMEGGVLKVKLPPHGVVTVRVDK